MAQRAFQPPYITSENAGDRVFSRDRKQPPEDSVAFASVDQVWIAAKRNPNKKNFKLLIAPVAFEPVEVWPPDSFLAYMPVEQRDRVCLEVFSS